jgi:hypothetical protein
MTGGSDVWEQKTKEFCMPWKAEDWNQMIDKTNRSGIWGQQNGKLVYKARYTPITY